MYCSGEPCLASSCDDNARVEFSSEPTVANVGFVWVFLRLFSCLFLGKESALSLLDRLDGYQMNYCSRQQTT